VPLRGTSGTGSSTRFDAAAQASVVSTLVLPTASTLNRWALHQVWSNEDFMQTRKLLIIAFLVFLTACSSTHNQPGLLPTEILLTETLSPTETPIPTHTATVPHPTDTVMATITTTATRIIPSVTPEFGVCPIDMFIKDAKITTAYDEYGFNYDLWAPHGTPIKSPGECNVISLFIDSSGTQGLHISCSDYPLNLAQRISYAHIDLAWNDYEILKIYGIPVDTFFDTDGKPKLGVENVPPVNNSRFHRGDSPVAYVGNTGDHQMPYHLHIDVWSIMDNKFSKLDPSKFFSCEP
jgi:hypothetical protein